MSIRSSRQIAKSAINALCLIVLAPIAIPVRLLSPFGKPGLMFDIGCHVMSVIPGVFGVFLRRAYYRVVLGNCGSDITISFGTIFAMRGSQIGNGSYIGTHCTIGLASIGANVLIGSNVDLIGGPNVHSFDRVDVPIKKQGGSPHIVRIGDGAWLGNSAVVMNDVGNECVVGAGSVVVKPCDDWGIYVGNPARKVGDRRDQENHV